MLNETPPAEIDVLLVGALTVDRFAGDRTSPGGSVLHAARALRLDGRSAAVVTLAGDEPAARAGLRELEGLARTDVEPARQTVTFHHDEGPAGRGLQLGAPADLLSRAPLGVLPRAVLYAPVADELGPSLGGQAFEGVTTGAILQGWLRRLEPGRPVGAVPLSSLSPPLRERLAGLELLVASTEDLHAEAAGPAAQLDAMRRAFGPHPLLALTAGREGAWLAEGSGAIHRIRPPRVLRDVSAVGAGDAFAALLLAGLARGVRPFDAAQDAASVTAEHLAERSGRTAHVVGDVHGMLDILVRVLRTAGLVAADGSWSGGRDELWLSGDLVDRGPDGVGVLDLVVRLAAEAAEVGGRVGSVLGNHELLLLAAREIPGAASGGPAGTMRGDWVANGGRDADLARLTDAHVAWLRALPAMARVGPALLIHADAAFYAELDASVSSANARIHQTLAAPNPESWDSLLAAFSDRRAFLHDPKLAARILERFGGRLLVHGHTAVASLIGQPPETVREAHVYAGGRCVAVDAGLFAGGPGFIYRLPRNADGPIMRG